jgi:hypothetical protein
VVTGPGNENFLAFFFRLVAFWNVLIRERGVSAADFAGTEARAPEEGLDLLRSFYDE